MIFLYNDIYQRNEVILEIGNGIFGKQYEIMIKNDSHADGTVDRILYENMIKLDTNSVDYLYNFYTDLNNHYEYGNRKLLENIIINFKNKNNENIIESIISYCKNIVLNCDFNIENMVLGGTEEEIILRGTDWCTDIARVACILFQVAGYPSRIVITANTKLPYHGHVVTEVYYNNKWGAADPTNGIIFINENKSPISAWDIKIKEIDSQYESVGISNYYVNEKSKYNYETSKINDYYRKILDNSNK